MLFNKTGVTPYYTHNTSEIGIIKLLYVQFGEGFGSDIDILNRRQMKKQLEFPSQYNKPMPAQLKENENANHKSI